MRKFTLFALLLLFSQLAAAQGSIVSQAAAYGQQYDSGQINFLQLNVLLNIERNKLYDELNSGAVVINTSDGERRGWNEATMRSMFGEPTQTEQWAWGSIEQKSVRLSSPVPAWRKPIYEGSRVKITLESWPQVIQRDGQTILFYDFNLRSDFNQLSQEINFAGNVEEIKQLLENSAGNEAQLQQAAEKAAKFEQALNQHLYNNKQSCSEILSSWLGAGKQTEKLRWEAAVYEGDTVVIRLRGDEQSEGENKWFNSHMEPDIRREIRSQAARGSPVRVDFQTGEQFVQRLKQLVNEAKRTAEVIDQNGGEAGHLYEITSEYQQISQQFMDKANRRELDLTLEQVIAEFEKIFAEQKDFKKENVKQIEFRKELFAKKEQRFNQHCRSANETACSELMCVNAACIGEPLPEMREGPPEQEQNYTGPPSDENYSIPQPLPQLEQRNETQPIGENQTQASAENQTTLNQPQANQPQSPQLPQEQQNQQPKNQSQQPRVGSLAKTYSPITGLIADIGSCQQTCNANQQCAADKGWCDCKQGFWDCDGDWINGCESEKQCKPCQSDSECAQPRCSEDNFRIVTFECSQGEGFEQEISAASVGGQCSVLNSGQFESGVWIGAWGEGFEPFDSYKQAQWSQGDTERCTLELEQAKKKRMELQSALNDQFFEWFFANVVTKDPNKFEEHMRSVWSIYDAFQQNSDETARALRCLGRSDWPSEYQPVSAEIKTDFGKVKVWEEKKRTNFWGVEQEVLSPYMRMWVFPPREVFKREFVKHIKEEGPKGPAPEELAQMRNWPPVMEKIRAIANAFGGDARLVIEAVDGSETLVKYVFIVNEKDLIKIEPAETYNGKVSATISFSLDFVYDVASGFAKEMDGERLQVPYWEHGKEEQRVVQDTAVVVKVFTRILQAIVTGEVKVTPASAIPNLVLAAKEFMALIMMGPG